MAGADGSVMIDTKLDSSGMKSGLASLGGIAKGAVGGITAAIGAVGAGLSAAGGFAIKAGSDFESGMSKVEAISGATGDELNQLTEKAKEMGAKTKFSATESASAFEYMAMAGWKTEDMLGGIEGVMNLAAASGEDLASVSDIVTDALTAFGMQASDSGRFADVLAAASSNANTNVGLMGATFKYVAPVAGAMGFSIEDTAAAIGLMANAGIKGEQAGTALRSVMTRLVKPPKDAAEALDALGVSAANSDGSMKPLREIIGELRTKFDGLSQSEQASYAASIAGQEGMSGLLAIVNAAPEDFDKLTSAIDNADGSALKMAETMQDNLQGQITILKSALEGLGIEFYESIQEPLKDAVKQGIGYVNQLTEAFKNGGLDGLVGEIGNVLADVVSQIINFAPAFVSSATSLIQSFVSGIQENLPQLVDGVVQALSALMQGILEILPQLLDVGMQLIGQLAIGIAQALPSLIPMIVQCVMSLIQVFYDNAPLFIEAVWQLLLGLVQGIINAIPVLLDALPAVIESMVSYLIQSLPIIIKIGIEIIAALVTGLVQAIPQLIAAIPEIITAIIAAFQNTDWSQIGRDILITIARGMLENMMSIAEAGQAIRNFFSETFQSASDGISTFVNETVPSAINSVIDWFNQLPENIGRVMGENIGRLMQFGLDIKNWVTKTFPEWFKSVVDWFKKLPSEIAKWLRDTLKKVQEWGKNLIDEAKTAIPKFINSVADYLKELPAKAVEAGKDFVKGIWEGISSAAGWLWDKIKEFAQGILDGIKDALDINSPSRESAKQIGVPTAQGVGVGFIDSLPDTYRRMQAAVDAETARFTARASVAANYTIAAQTPVPAAPSGSSGGETVIFEPGSVVCQINPDTVQTFDDMAELIQNQANRAIDIRRGVARR